MEAIGMLSQKYGFRVIEDASHAVGGKYKGNPVGSCDFSDITVFSFHPVKIITTGEGGMALTNNQELAERMARFRTHGITRDERLMTHASDGPWYYQQIDLGYNYRLTDIQAVLGISQMKRLDTYVAARRSVAEFYNNRLSNLPLTLPVEIPDALSAYHLYVIRLQLDETGKSHREVFEELRAAGIGVNLHYIPLHLQPYYAALGFKPGDFPKAERYYSDAISIPMFATITEEQKERVVDAIGNVLTGS